MLNEKAQKQVVLASISPRRREIVASLVPPVDLIDPVGEEGPPRNGETPEQFVLRQSRAKVRGVADIGRPAVILGADTVVVLDGEILGKPGSTAEATRVLGRLRGRTHRVVTGVAALNSQSGLWMTSTKSTDVTFRVFADAELDRYVASGEPFDKAGGYAVQDPSFDPAVTTDGCYLNVVGLPLCEVVTLLGKLEVASSVATDWRAPVSCRDCPLDRRDGAQQS